MADHSVAMLVMRQKNHDVKVKRNEHVNVVKLANAQRVANLGQRLDAQCCDLKKKKHTSDWAHSQRMKMMSFSNLGLESNARNRNAADLKAQCQESAAKRQTQQNKVDAANERHKRNISDENMHHGQEMREMKSSSDARTAAQQNKVDAANERHKRN